MDMEQKELLISASNEKFYLRKACLKDINDVFELSNEDYVRKQSIRKEKIMRSEHKIWFTDSLNSITNEFYVLTDLNDNFLGQIRYKADNSEAIVSISLSNLVMGKGLSKSVLKTSMILFIKEHKIVKNIVAYIFKSNIPSIKLFESTGYDLIDSSNDLTKYVYKINGENYDK